MIPHHLGVPVAAIFFAAGIVSAQMANPVLDGQLSRAKAAAPKNRAAVQAALEKANLPTGQVAWFAVPAMSDRMRLHDTYPVDGRLAGDLRVVVARDEFEPASFQLFAFQDFPEVELKVGPLRDDTGNAINQEDIDLRVVKLWLQNGDGWQCYYSDVGLMLVPDLLLHDENMVKVDLARQANYARLKDENGERHVWISAPRQISANGFDPVLEPFSDTESLQPVALERDTFKQFVLTVHAPKDQRPGVYRGDITVTAKGKSLAEIPVAVRVLPFALPPPSPYEDPDGVFIVSFCSGGTDLAALRRRFGDDAKAKSFYREYLRSMRDHNVSHPAVNQDKENYDLLRELGLPTKPVMMGKSFAPWFALNFGGRMSFDNMMAAKRGADKCARFYQDLVGHNDILLSYGDEQGTAFVTAHRRFFRYYLEKGMKMGCAGHEPLLWKGGYTYDVYPMPRWPNDTKLLRPWKEMGGKYLGFYACQHTGSENPQYIRMQHGLLGYFNGLNMVYNYEFAIGPWNDLVYSLYRPMVVSYLNAGGLVETFAYAGFREGIDDIRYATCLKRLTREAEAAEDVEVRLLGRKALLYLALLPRESMDLNAVRAEMVEYILKLRKALGK